MITHVLTQPYTPPTASDASNLPLPHQRLFLDMAYRPRNTPLLQIAAALNWEPIGGIQAMIEQGLAQSRMWQSGDASVDVACGDRIGDDVMTKARDFVEQMADVVVVGKEYDRAQDSPDAPFRAVHGWLRNTLSWDDFIHDLPVTVHSPSGGYRIICPTRTFHRIRYLAPPADSIIVPHLWHTTQVQRGNNEAALNLCTFLTNSSLCATSSRQPLEEKNNRGWLVAVKWLNWCPHLWRWVLPLPTLDTFSWRSETLSRALVARSDCDTLTDLIVLRDQGSGSENIDNYFSKERQKAHDANNVERSFAFAFEKSMENMNRSVWIPRTYISFAHSRYRCAPGGFAQYLLRNNKRAYGIGISLPDEQGGSRFGVTYPDYLARYELHWADLTMFDLAPSIPKPVNSLHDYPPLPFKLCSRDLVVCDAQWVLNPDNLNRPWNWTRLIVSQLLIALHAVSPHGNIFIRLSCVERTLTGRILLALCRISDLVRTVKSDRFQSMRSYFYVLAQRVNRQSSEFRNLVVALERLWYIMTFEGENGYGRDIGAEDEELITTDEEILSEEGLSTIVQLGTPIWAIQYDHIPDMLSRRSHLLTGRGKGMGCFLPSFFTPPPLLCYHRYHIFAIAPHTMSSLTPKPALDAVAEAEAKWLTDALLGRRDCDTFRKLKDLCPQGIAVQLRGSAIPPRFRSPPPAGQERITQCADAMYRIFQSMHQDSDPYSFARRACCFLEVGSNPGGFTRFLLEQPHTHGVGVTLPVDEGGIGRAIPPNDRFELHELNLLDLVSHYISSGTLPFTRTTFDSIILDIDHSSPRLLVAQLLLALSTIHDGGQILLTLSCIERPQAARILIAFSKVADYISLSSPPQAQTWGVFYLDPTWDEEDLITPWEEVMKKSNMDLIAKLGNPVWETQLKALYRAFEVDSNQSD
ncbi:FtsJ domain-containing protein [Rhizoctonia solani AG-1 IA]|uniref:FtsJ domain-containing protein n=1 Tax=Thanatephorus cucumeris (strain AG1-IA) TaxID=983506 RepID=L8X211_THACA|nr:FtsJ domain-containing protein [Rhizoctonia solani AG-1 IA]